MVARIGKIIAADGAATMLDAIAGTDIAAVMRAISVAAEVAAFSLHGNGAFSHWPGA